ncbi:spore germination protein [Paenibacillus sp. FSL W7-1287]|uniref:spore germination protein n=1 Tax=Paenibacillus sp. FSL W7-1287 TaxID=2954538 RepID=UPI0030F8C071
MKQEEKEKREKLVQLEQQNEQMQQQSQLEQLTQREQQDQQMKQDAMEQQESIASSPELAPRLEWFKLRLERVAEVVFHEFTVDYGHSCVLIYMSGMFDIKQAERNLLEPLLGKVFYMKDELTQYLFSRNQLPVTELHWVDRAADALQAILQGYGILLFQGEPRMLVLPYANYETRSIVEAPNETVLRGPREAFIEDIGVNISLLRRRIKSPLLKTEEYTFGRHTSTPVVLAYMEGICKDSLIHEVRRRISYLDIDGVLSSSQIEETITDRPSSPFTQIQYTERPDVVSSSILEGRVAILVDNTPIALLAPTTIFSKMQSSEDYYQNFVAATAIRYIRYLFLFISFLLPSFYIAISTFHAEMIPFRLLVTVASAREVVPFPALLEAFIMEISFEALREASVRIPKSIGQTVSIIGALIIGTAAVQAGIVSAAMVIIVSVTGIASFIIPSFDLGLSFRLMRFPLMLLAGTFGIFGIACGMFLIYAHALNLESFGVPYLTPMAPSNRDSAKDVWMRAPWWRMNERPSFAAPNNRNRQKKQARGWKLEQEELE